MLFRSRRHRRGEAFQVHPGLRRRAQTTVGDHLLRRLVDAFLQHLGDLGVVQDIDLATKTMRGLEDDGDY